MFLSYLLFYRYLLNLTLPDQFGIVTDHTMLSQSRIPSEPSDFSLDDEISDKHQD